MRSTRLLPLLFTLVPAFGCGDDIKLPDPTEIPDPALNGVFPAKGFTDRTLRVEISGDGTEFTGTPTVDFGTGITVGTVELSSPSTLFATITIAGNATLGKHDVKVTNGDAELTLTAAFEVQNPLEIVLDGPVLQGGLNQIAIINHDPESPFLGTLEVTAGTGVEIFIDDSTQSESLVLGTVFVDTNATTGQLVVKDLLLDTITSRGAEVTVTPRTATALTSPGKGPTFLASGANLANTTALFSFTGVSAIYRGSTFIDDPNTAPPIMMWLVDGKWSLARGFQQDDVMPLANGQNMFVVVFDGFATGTVFDLAVDEFHSLPDAVALAEVEDNDFFSGTPQDIAQDVTLFTGLLNSDDSGFDDLVVTLQDGDQIRVTTTMGRFGSADTIVDIFDDGFNFIDENDDISGSTGLFSSDLTTDPLPAGTYIIEIFPFFFGFDDEYEAGITIIHNPPA